MENKIVSRRGEHSHGFMGDLLQVELAEAKQLKLSLDQAT